MKTLLRRIEELEGDTEVTRERLLKSLWLILDYAVDKVMTKQAQARNKPGWARVAVSAASAAGNILKDADLDELAERITAVEEKLS